MSTSSNPRYGTSIVVKHREYVTDLLAGSTTDLAMLFQRYINAGDPGIFPYLSPIATMYEYYKFRSLSFEYVTNLASS